MMINTTCRIFPIILMVISALCGIFFRTSKFNKFAALLTCVMFLTNILLPNEIINFSWFSIGDLDFSLSMNFDKTSAIVCSVISIILFCLHMAKNSVKHDEKLNIKFGLIHLFVFFMDIAILSNNIFLFFISIEALGGLSAIFVSLERENPKYTIRTFAFNKFSSVMFLAGTVLIAVYAKSFEFQNIAEYCSSPKVQNLFIPTAFLLISCFCKGATFPFSFWLLDATHANIFVSIIIHTATIISIGILFIAKCYFLFESFPALKNVMTVLGTFTSIYMGVNALFHNNVKKIIVCLTCCASGAMFVCCGIGEYSLAILYFITHAFYKSLFFLSFLYVINALSGEQNILRMGGINLIIPRISDTVWISFFSSCGLPFLISFFAKVPFASALELSGRNDILSIHMFVNILQIIAMFRLILVSMYGASRTDEAVLSRVSSANSTSLKSFWTLFFCGSIATFSCWCLYEWRELDFGYGGVVFVKQMFDYFLENISEVVQFLIAILLAVYFVKYSILNKYPKLKSFLFYIFKCDYIYGYLISCITKYFLYISKKFNLINLALNRYLNYVFTHTIYSACRMLQTKHKKMLSSHLIWIALGMIINLLSFIYWRKF